MKTHFLTSLFLIISLITYSQITVTKADGSSVQTDIGYGFKVNNGSTLIRQKIIINDTLCPLQLQDVSVETTYSERSYNFKSSGSVIAKLPITAYEIYYMIYDVFGEHIKTLSSTDVEDLVGQADLKGKSSWYATANNASEYFISVTYVANARTKSGQIWHYNYNSIKEQLDKLKISFEEGYLPKKDPEK